MKSITKRMIEIPQPDHPYFESIYVVLRANSPAVRISTQRAEAEKYVAGLVSWKRGLWPEAKKRGILLAAAVLAVGLSITALVIWL